MCTCNMRFVCVVKGLGASVYFVKSEALLLSIPLIPIYSHATRGAPRLPLEASCRHQGARIHAEQDLMKGKYSQFIGPHSQRVHLVA